jgi:hypothetical protein
VRFAPLLLLAACATPPPTEGGEVRITPQSPDTRDDLVAEIVSVAGGPGGGAILYRWAWQRDGSVVDGLDGDRVPSDLTAKGEAWRVVLTPANAADGDPLTAGVTIGNAPPALTLTVGPAGADTSNEIVASATATDPDGDPVTIAWAWSADGQARPALTGPTVPPTATARGQTWRVTATPSDGAAWGEPASAEIAIGNARPEVRDAALSPPAPYTLTPLVAHYATFDADGDVVVVSLAWTRDGTPLSATGATLPPSQYVKGQRIGVTLTPTDGTSSGEPVALGPVTILNTPPSAPGIAIPISDPFDPMTCFIEAPSVDDDRDAVTYAFSWRRDGAAYTGPTTATVHAGDTIPAAQLERDQEWTCTVVATDGEDSAPPTSVTATVRSRDVAFRAGLYWVKARTNAARTDHASICAAHGLTATARTVTVVWNAALMADVADDLGYESVGDVSDAVQSMWCYDEGSSYPAGTFEGACETHNFGSTYDNYGRWGSYPNQRPVFTCR